MLRDLDKEDMIGEEGTTEWLWDFMFESGPWRKKGSKLNVAKYMSIFNRRR